jgi:hypothetical protein
MKVMKSMNSNVDVVSNALRPNNRSYQITAAATNEDPRKRALHSAHSGAKCSSKKARTVATGCNASLIDRRDDICKLECDGAINLLLTKRKVEEQKGKSSKNKKHKL